VEGTCRKLGLEALVNKSIDFVYPAWVSIEAWLPAGAPGATYRVFGTFTIEPMPYSRFEFQVTIGVERGERKKKYGPYQPLAAADVGAWTTHILDQGPRPPRGHARIRKFPWELYYPKNKVLRLRRDPVALFTTAAFIASMALFGAAPLIGFLAFVLAGIGAVVSWRRRKLVVNAGRPLAEPRTLRLVDNWQIMVNDLGPHWQTVRARLFERLSEGVPFNIHSRLENISYLTPDGKQEREQLVLSQGRGLVFCHVYRYGEELYIGWDAYLNYGQWIERALASGYDPGLQSPTVINTVTPGIARATEYDLIDLNSLTEWVHSRIVQVVKRAMAEHKLDQEIDFKIVRGERQSLLRDQEPEKRRPRFGRTSVREA
jgi:hypothetical protein